MSHYLRYKSSDCKKKSIILRLEFSAFPSLCTTELLSDVGKNSCYCWETEFYFCDISSQGHIYHLMGQGRAVSLKKKKSRRKGIRSIFWAKSNFSSLLVRHEEITFFGVEKGQFQ